MVGNDGGLKRTKGQRGMDASILRMGAPFDPNDATDVALSQCTVPTDIVGDGSPIPFARAAFPRSTGYMVIKYKQEHYGGLLKEIDCLSAIAVKDEWCGSNLEKVESISDLQIDPPSWRIDHVCMTPAVEGQCPLDYVRVVQNGKCIGESRAQFEEVFEDLIGFELKDHRMLQMVNLKSEKLLIIQLLRD